MKAGRNQALNRGSQKLVTAVAEQLLGLRIYEYHFSSFIDNHHGIRGGFDQILKALVQSFDLFRQACFLRNIFGDEQKTDGLSKSVPARGKDYACIKSLTIFPYPGYRAFPFARAKGLLQHGVRLAGGDVFRGVQNVSVGAANDLVGFVTIKPRRTLIPQQDVAVEVLANN